MNSEIAGWHIWHIDTIGPLQLTVLILDCMSCAHICCRHTMVQTYNGMIWNNYICLQITPPSNSCKCQLVANEGSDRGEVKGRVRPVMTNWDHKSTNTFNRIENPPHLCTRSGPWRLSWQPSWQCHSTCLPPKNVCVHQMWMDCHQSIRAGQIESTRMYQWRGVGEGQRTTASKLYRS